MKIFEIIRKSAIEQIRNFWILLLTVIMAPFFVGVYFLINESSKPVYDLLIVNNDKGINIGNEIIKHGDELLFTAESEVLAQAGIPMKISKSENLEQAILLLQKKKADAIIVIPEGFSDSLALANKAHRPAPPEIEIMGDMNNFNYIISAIYGSELVRIYVEKISGFPSPFLLKETNLSQTAGFNEFDLYMPGLLVLSIIMLMFSASIAFVIEVEYGTILRFRLSGIRIVDFIGGVTMVQIVIGIISVLITFGTALLLGFQSNGSLWLALMIVILVSLSIIGFSVILAALTKSSNEILVIGNFPLFLFMFFTGAVFPMEGKAIFSIGSYGINLQGLMSPTHAVSAMKKVMLMNAPFSEVVPEIASLLVLTFLYFLIGSWLFNRRHITGSGD